jgi:predicted transcriptional regulator
MTEQSEQPELLALTAEIVASYVGNNTATGAAGDCLPTIRW